MKQDQVGRIGTISEFHVLRGLAKPEHPLISVVDMNDITIFAKEQRMSFGFYFISLKRARNIAHHYGQHFYDLNAGVLSFMSPGQVFKLEKKKNGSLPTGQMLLIHPDFLWNTSLAKHIKQYEFFDYSVDEALLLSETEETVILKFMEQIKQEYHITKDKFSKQIIITLTEAILNFSERYYNRQFTIRGKNNHQILTRLDKTLTEYFNDEDLMSTGLPTVKYISDSLNVSPSYLGSLLRVLTGQNTQQHIHNKLIEKAKEKLSLTDQSASEIAYKLGFGHSQSFSKLFKTKTKISPSEFRKFFK